jgi:hypothetical protein
LAVGTDTNVGTGVLGHPSALAWFDCCLSHLVFDSDTLNDLSGTISGFDTIVMQL